jgi:hypothetical protein
MGGIPVPSSLNVSEGVNATVQIITNSHDGNGLYNVSSLIRSRSPCLSPVFFQDGLGSRKTDMCVINTLVRRYHIYIHSPRTTIILHQRHRSLSSATCCQRVRERQRLLESRW